MHEERNTSKESKLSLSLYYPWFHPFSAVSPYYYCLCFFASAICSHQWLNDFGCKPSRHHHHEVLSCQTQSVIVYTMQLICGAIAIIQSALHCISLLMTVPFTDVMRACVSVMVWSTPLFDSSAYVGDRQICIMWYPVMGYRLDSCTFPVLSAIHYQMSGF